MTTESFFVIAIGLAGVGILGWCWQTLQNPPEKTPQRMNEEDQKDACFKVVQSLWQQHANNSIIDSMAKKAQDDQAALEWARQALVSFDNPDISRFYDQYVKGKPFFLGASMDAVQELLAILEQAGDVPSVVRQHEHQEEAERPLAETYYDVLHRVPLYRHSLNTAEEALRGLEVGNALRPKTVIAALAHDLGKLPENYGQYYKSAEHALVGAMALNEIPSIKNLPYYKAIWEAVRGHHTPSTDKFVLLIREADQSARRRELAEAAGAVFY